MTLIFSQIVWMWPLTYPCFADDISSCSIFGAYVLERCVAISLFIAFFSTYKVQQALRVQWRVFGVFVCFDLYFVNYRSWQAEILQERAEGCIQVDLQKKICQDRNNVFLFCGFVGVVFGHKFKAV